MGGEQGFPANRIPVKRIPTVDDAIIGIEMGEQFVDYHVHGFSGLDHDDDLSRTFHGGYESGDIVGSHEQVVIAVLVNKSFRPLGGAVVYGNIDTPKSDVPGEVRAHDGETDESDLSCFHNGKNYVASLVYQVGCHCATFVEKKILDGAGFRWNFRVLGAIECGSFGFSDKKYERLRNVFYGGERNGYPVERRLGGIVDGKVGRRRVFESRMIREERGDMPVGPNPEQSDVDMGNPYGVFGFRRGDVRPDCQNLLGE